MLLCTWRLCCCKWPDALKLLLHSEHLYGLSPVWPLMWMFRLPEWLNVLSHMWHLYGFSPLWILLCATKWRNDVNRLLQTVHSIGFFPKWIRICTARITLLAVGLSWCGCSVISLLSASIFTSKQLSPVYIATWHLTASNQHWMTSHQCDQIHSNCNIYTCDNQLDTTSSCHSVVVDDTAHCCSSLSSLRYYLCYHYYNVLLYVHWNQRCHFPHHTLATGWPS